MFAAIANAYGNDVARRSERQADLAKRFRKELGRVIGTDADPKLWARHHDCSPAEAQSAIDHLLRTGDATQRGGRLYLR